MFKYLNLKYTWYLFQSGSGKKKQKKSKTKGSTTALPGVLKNGINQGQSSENPKEAWLKAVKNHCPGTM